MKHTMGTIEVITGSMFCGKTDELIRRLRRATIARQKVQVFKPVIDHRYALEKVTSHAGSEYAARPIPHARALLAQLDPATRSEEHTSELQSLRHLVCRLLLEK